MRITAVLSALALLCLLCAGCGGGGGSSAGGNGNIGDGAKGVFASSMVVFGYNDLGMHCMNQDFSQMMILPPFNTLHALVLRRGENPQFVTSGVTVSYSVPGNTSSANKTNFWTYAPALLGVSPAPNIGLAGNGLAGTMGVSGTNLRDWQAVGIPLTPITDGNVENAYQLAAIKVSSGGTVVASTSAVTPVSWEINCALCHNGSDAPPILQAHDQMHGTDLQHSTPVLCGKCHAQPPLGALAPGQSGVPPLSTSMHSAHATRMNNVLATLNGNACYACHPGKQTECLRDVHLSHGLTCTDCHTSMAAVGAAGRRPWVDEPRCDSCHHVAGHTYEQANTLYRNSVGHHGVPCEACHGSPHAVTPTVVANDNVQAIGLQGHAGVINKCAVCHINTPDDGFTHTAAGGN